MSLTYNEKYILNNINTFEKSDQSPSFPLTEIKKVTIKGFTDLWIKDESTNPTGTHKDRMARQIVQIYKQILERKQFIDDSKPLPHFSLITAGSAGYAIQKQLQQFGLPCLKVIIDHDTRKSIEQSLRDLGCETYRIHLGKKWLTTRDILRITHNDNGFDITSNQAFEPQSRFYDRLSYEIMNHNPEYIFVPYGSGHLYENILNTNKQIIENFAIDSVYTGDIFTRPGCHIIGATSYNSSTKAKKLYSRFRPWNESSKDYIQLLSQRGLCGEKSGIGHLQEEYLKQAYTILQENQISAEYSAAGGLALALQMRDQQQIDTDKKIIVVSTGSSVCK